MWYTSSMQKVFQALSESNRYDIVELLRQHGSLTVGELVDKTDLRQPQVSKHLRILHEAGVVEMHPDANRRVYKLRPQAFTDLDHWLASYRQIWEDRFDQLDDYLDYIQKKGDRK